MHLQPLTQLGRDEDPIALGNAGLFIKPNGDVRLYSAFGHKELADFTPEELVISEKLHALTVALRTPQIMDILMTMSNDPNIIGAKSN